MATSKSSLVVPPADIAAHWGIDLPELVERLPLGSARNLVARAGDVVLRIESTSVASVEWEHDLLAYLSARVPEVIAPLPAPDGTTFLRVDGGVASVYPFVEGTPVTPDDPAAVGELPGLLARMHLRGLDWRARMQRPERSSFRDLDWERNLWWDVSIVERPPGLEHAYRQVRKWVAEPPPLLTSPVHGDFHPRNALARDGRIVGVFDWEYARLDWPAAEVSTLVWIEAVGEGGEIVAAAVERVIDAYKAAGGPAETTFLVPFLRLNCVAAALYSLTRAARGQSWNPAFVERQLRVLERLA